MKLNCVILNYNDAKTVCRLVHLIHDYDVLEQIVVVDNHSTDASVEELMPLEDEKVTVLPLLHNGGYGAGNNTGIRFAVQHNHATHVLIANPDVAFSQECLQKLLHIFARHPKVGAATARMQDASYPDRMNGWPLGGFVRELLSMGPVSRRVFRGMLEYPASRFAGRKAVYVDAVHGSLLMVDAEKFMDSGGYDEGIFLYQEEAVLAWRMQRSGYRTVLALNCSYDHQHSVSISKTFAGAMERQRLREKSTLYYMKHYLFVNRVQEWIAGLWFFGIRMEIAAAGWVAGLLRRRV